jgi:hypothetical protein
LKRDSSRIAVDKAVEKWNGPKPINGAKEVKGLVSSGIRKTGDRSVNGSQNANGEGKEQSQWRERWSSHQLAETMHVHTVVGSS